MRVSDYITLLRIVFSLLERMFSTKREKKGEVSHNSNIDIQY